MIAHVRPRIGDRIETALPGEDGQFANALVTGDREGISDETTEALRVSASAISSRSPACIWRWWPARCSASCAVSSRCRRTRACRPIKKWAAAARFGGDVLSRPLGRRDRDAALLHHDGGDSPCRDFRPPRLQRPQRRSGGDHRPFLTPGVVLSASFQMSFAATLALIAGFEASPNGGASASPMARRRADAGAHDVLWIGGLC